MADLFQYPHLLHLLWAAPLLIAFATAYHRWRLRAVALWGRLPNARQTRWSPARDGLFLLALVLIVIAAAQPRRMGGLKPVTQQGADVVVALDISQSMLAADVRPNRLEPAKGFALQLMRQLSGHRLGLVFFAGAAAIQTPPTADYTAWATLLQSASPELTSAPGTDLALAIETSRKSLLADAAAGQAIILITDGENHGTDALSAAEAAAKAGVTIFAVGVGADEGGPIPQGENAFKRDQQGQLIISKLDREGLQALAEAGRSKKAYHISENEKAVKAIVEAVNSLEKSEVFTRARMEYTPLFQWFLLPALILLALIGAWEWRQKVVR